MKKFLMVRIRYCCLVLAVTINASGCFQEPVTSNAISESSRSVLDDARRVLNAFETNELQDFKGHWTGRRLLFMPNPGKKMALHDAILYSGDYQGFYFEIFIDDLSAVTGDVVSISSGEKQWMLSFAGDSIVAHVGKTDIRSSVIGSSTAIAGITIEKKHDARLKICVQGKCATTDKAIPEIGIRIDRTSTAVALSNPQVIDGEGRHQTVEAAINGYAPSPHPRGVLSWERLAARKYFDAITLFMAREICLTSKEFAADPVCRGEGIPAFARRSLLQLSGWQSWRTYDARIPLDELADNPSWKTWDRGNWGNGFFPAAAAFYYLLAKDDLTVSETNAVLDAYERNGRRFLRDPLFNENARHWVNRSTNHGAIILGNAYAAELIFGSCRETDLARTLREAFRYVAERSFHDGVYSESKGYKRVFVLYSLAASIARNHCFDEPISEFFDTFYAPGALEEMARYMELSTLKDGSALLSFGDCCGTRLWYEELLTLTAPYSPFLRDLLHSNRKRTESNALLAFIHREDTGSNFFDWPNASDETSCFVSDIGLGLSTRVVDGEQIKLGLISTLLHRTHNSDWDLGSVVLAFNDEILIGERLEDVGRGTRSALRHSTAWSEAVTKAAPACFEEGAKCRAGRRLNGTVTVEGEDGTASQCRMAGRLNTVGWSQRSVWFDDTSEADVAIVVADSIDVGRDGRVLTANFEIAGEVVAQDAESVSLKTRAGLLVFNWEGYTLLSVSGIPGTTKPVTSLRLRGSAAKDAKGQTEIGRTRVELHFSK